MSTQAQTSDLLNQAQTYENSADALSSKIADASISIDDRKQIFNLSVSLRSQAFILRSQAAEGIIKDLKTDVVLLQAQIDLAKGALSIITKTKSLINVVSGLAATATAVASGQPSAISSALVNLQNSLAGAMKV